MGKNQMCELEKSRCSILATACDILSLIVSAPFIE